MKSTTFFFILLMTFTLDTCTRAQDIKIASFQSAKSASIVLRKERKFTDRGWHDSSLYFVIIGSYPSREFLIDCSPKKYPKPELSLDEKAERVAYRCGKDTPWIVLYLGQSAPRLFNLCRKIPALSWEQIPSFEDERARFIDCMTLDGAYANRFKEILKESKERGGDKAAGEFLIQTLSIDVKDFIDAAGRSEWDQAWLDLSKSEKKSKLPKLNAVLPEPNASVFGLLRALKFTDLSQVQADILESQAERMASLPEGDDFRSNSAQRLGLDIALRALVSRNLPAAARISCKAAEKFASNGKSLIIPRIQLAAIAAQKLPCRIDPVLDRNKCDLTFACCNRGFTCADSIRHACTDLELAKLVKLELSRPARDPWKNEGGFGYELLLAAARVQNTESARKFLGRVAAAPTCSQ